MVVGHERWQPATDEPLCHGTHITGRSGYFGINTGGVTIGTSPEHGSNQQRYESFVAKLNSDGDWLWANQYGICEHYTSAKMGPFTFSGGQPIFGELYAEPHTNGSKTYITMVAPNGSFVWLKSFNTNHTSYNSAKFVILDIATNVHGDVYFGGVWNEGINRVETDDELSVISYNRSDRDRGFVAKMTHDGRLL